MSRRPVTIIEIEIEAVTPGIAVFHVTGWGAAELYVFRSPDDGAWRAVGGSTRGLDGGRLPARWSGGLPPLPAVIAGAFPELAR